MTREEIIAANPIVDFVRSRGHELRPAGKNFVTNGCPVTKHKNLWHRPVGIDIGKGVWYCGDCKRGGTVIDWLMFEKGISPAYAMRELGGSGDGSEERGGRIVCAYDYTDESGKVLFQAVRLDPKDFYQQRPDGKGGWIKNLQGVRRVLYHLPEVLKAQTVCVAEGEKDADNLRKLGFLATTNPMGAGKWRDEYAETLCSKDVIVFGDVGDNNGDGERHTQHVIESLSGKAKSKKHVVLPDGFHDVSDYIASLPEGTARAAILKLIKETPEVTAADLQAGQEAAKVEVVSAGDDGQDDLTSLTSCAVEYPALPDKAAFYGLAGEIVKRIEPHTEADPAALLVQFLVAFGNIIGRNAHSLADGAEHYLNLFCVLVGDTSKGRKGTSLHHILRLFTDTGNDWRKNCLASGLSSGEGVIHAVRDEIKQTKPVKDKGKYTGESIDVVVDSGVADKRLMVIESEFCSALKVMSREGNILSPTLRQAWDFGNLRILTKNTPARATGAHISIIAHITRLEARHELTETESANGFGNRILWTAVRRSKSLPEGGESVSVADLVERLEAAVDFAFDVGELHRSEEARALWASVYVKLSEGRPGLFGAITARAEAQVLRLSCIYAVLDCSRTVEIVHLRAALALWAYCERSAGWVFESGTGSKNADRILAALKVAGDEGLTKSQITMNVFNRNSTKHDIDEALRLLHHLDLARCAVEKTGGRSAERWFYKPSEHEVYEESTQKSNMLDNQLDTKLDTSYSSSPPLSKNTSLVESDPGAQPDQQSEAGFDKRAYQCEYMRQKREEAKQPPTEPAAEPVPGPSTPIVGDEKGVGRL